jgi:hypothetical protein
MKATSLPEPVDISFCGFWVEHVATRVLLGEILAVVAVCGLLVVICCLLRVTIINRMRVEPDR